MGLPEDRAHVFLDHLISLVAQGRAGLGGAPKLVVELTCCLHLSQKEPLAQHCPVEILALSFSGKGHMRGVPSMGLEIESWHLPSTWIPCQASRICGFIYMPSTLLLKAPALADPSAWNILPPDLHMVSAPGSSCRCPCPQHSSLLPPAVGFSLAWITTCYMACVVSCLLSVSPRRILPILFIAIYSASAAVGGT